MSLVDHHLQQVPFRLDIIYATTLTHAYRFIHALVLWYNITTFIKGTK